MCVMGGEASPRLRGLVYDDDPDTRRAVAAILARCGFDLAGHVASPADALVAAGSLPDVIVLDLALSGARGLGILAALHAVAPACTLVVLSPFDRLKEAALDAGACDFIDKRDMRQLERCLRRVAEQAAPGPPADAPTAQPSTVPARSGSRSTNAFPS